MGDKPAGPSGLSCQVFVSSQEAEEEASHLRSSSPLLPNREPSAYSSAYQGVCLTPSLSPLCLIYVVLGIHAFWTSTPPTKLHHIPTLVPSARTWLESWPVDSCVAEVRAY